MDNLKSGFKRLSMTLGFDPAADAKAKQAADSATGVKEVLNETAQKLDERGERLERVDEQTEELANQAAGFADLAKEVANQQADRKWWQL